MKKLKFMTVFVILTLISCEERKVEPIEKYKGFVIAREEAWFTRAGEPYASFVTLKNKDSTIETSILTFDAQKYNVGDTIK